MASHAVDWREEMPRSCRGGALTVGNFDGVHRGHAALLAELRRQARRLSGPAVVLTFDPHPLALLRPDLTVLLLTTAAQRVAMLHRLGVDEVLTLRTTPDLLHLRAAEFFEHVIRRGLNVRALVEGPNFAFGRDREGDLGLLEQLCNQSGLTLDVVPPVIVDGFAVSSSLIRTELSRGAVEAARRLLGRPYRITGLVGTGAQRGRTIGIPTANLEQIATVIPADGVYAGRAIDPQGQQWPAALNVGANLTFGEQQRHVEVHLIGFSGDLYGQTLTVDFLQRLRDTRKFNDRAELVAQLRQDIQQAVHLASESTP